MHDRTRLIGRPSQPSFENFRVIVDTHAHLTDETLVSRLPEFLSLADDAGVKAILAVGTTRGCSSAAVSLAERYRQVRAAVGIHPNTCCQADEDDWSHIERLCRHERVAALGETGLDRHWDDCPWNTQVDYFCRHLALSMETELPVVIHTRECAEETLELLQEQARAGPLRGVMHSYTGSTEVALACVELGLYISFAGMVTFKNADELRQVAAAIPSDRILVETDSPYLTPHPHRGQRPNHPAMVVHTLNAVAKVRGVSAEVLERQTTENALQLFGAW